MKKFTLFLLIIGMYQCVNAQGTDVGISMGWGITRLRNINTSVRRPDLNPEVSLAPMIGIRAVHFFTPAIAVEFEADYSLVNQNYDGDSSGTELFEAKDEVKYLEIPVLFEYTESHIYAEIGPKLSLFTGGFGNMESSPSSSLDYSNLNIKNGFKSFVLSGVAGAGARFEMAKNLILKAGLRISYGLTDATKQIPPDEYFALAGENKLGMTSKYAHLGIGFTNKYNYKFTTLIRSDLLVSVSYHLPEGK